MKVWILNIVGVSLMGILIEILLPNGSTNKYIKGILSLVLMYVIISPIISVFTNYKVGNILDFINNDYIIDYEFVDNVNIEKNNYYEVELEKLLNENGYENVDINIIYNVLQQNKIEYVKISTKNLVINKNTTNIDIKDEMLRLITSKLNIDKSKVFYE